MQLTRAMLGAIAVFTSCKITRHYLRLSFLAPSPVHSTHREYITPSAWKNSVRIRFARWEWWERYHRSCSVASIGTGAISGTIFSSADISACAFPSAAARTLFIVINGGSLSSALTAGGGALPAQLTLPSVNVRRIMFIARRAPLAASRKRRRISCRRCGASQSPPYLSVLALDSPRLPLLRISFFAL